MHFIILMGYKWHTRIYIYIHIYICGYLVAFGQGRVRNLLFYEKSVGIEPEKLHFGAIRGPQWCGHGHHPASSTLLLPTWSPSWSSSWRTPWRSSGRPRRWGRRRQPLSWGLRNTPPGCSGTRRCRRAALSWPGCSAFTWTSTPRSPTTLTLG